MKLIWQGTDSLFLVKFPKQLKRTKIFYVMVLRLFAKLSDIFVQEHYVCGDLVSKNLTKFGMKKRLKQFTDIPFYPDKIAKKPHNGFNILYYFPKKDTKFNRWLYGYDIYQDINNHFKSNSDINFIIVDGTSDMSTIYPIIDLLIRPNRHDGIPRMVEECKLNNIPYLWSNENPDKSMFINTIQSLYEASHK